MNISVRTLIIVATITLAGGLLLGWLLFGGTLESNHQHTSISEIWTCSMHPQIRQNEPGSCPICGMDLIPLEDDNGLGVDQMAVSMSPTAMQLANVSTVMVGTETPTKNIRLNGKIQMDERLNFSQTTHFPGRIEKLSVNFTGEYVSKGSEVASLYSPSLVTAQEELFEAYKIRESQPNLYKATREKLKNWKLSENQIDQILSFGKVQDRFPVLADQSGYVISKKVNLGDYVNRGQALFEIANLTRVWAQFDVYENDLLWINKGDSIEFMINSLPGQSFIGKIDYIDPVINPKTRVTKARVVVQNDDGRLKPEMFVTGMVKAKSSMTGDQLTIPKSAVMWTGKRSIVYVRLQSDQGLYFKMREVTLGPALGDAYIIESGLEAGEEIVVNGTFSIDAAAQLAGKPSMMNPQSSLEETLNPDQLQINESNQVYESDPKFQEQLRTVFEAYLPVKDALVLSDIKTATQEAEKLQTALDKVDMKLVLGDAHMEWMKDLEVLQKSINGIAKEKEIEKVRVMLSPLSDQLFYTLRKFQVKVDGYRQYCPMAFDFKGAFWLSDSDEILNPYFGDAMLTCGNVEEEL
jgi:Cu(I)/Ag(I) efflux system membrane fusion protein